MSLRKRLETEIYDFANENDLEITQLDLLYAGPTMRTRHTLVLGFTDVGLFTFQFKLGEAVMHFLAKEQLRRIEMERKTLVYKLKIQALAENGSLEEGNYLVSKSVIGRKWHKDTVKRLLSNTNSGWFEGGNEN
ncbi:hypothetical protein MFLO_14722 [Listeria floridensis FSL S10-1187]|uniref:Uncharacterized protein n=1 Tax=Listeria floridensis FSL S10-1187 TaxID=1265817 RepID=A0ABP3AVG9_9LIST|nr:hypothetical protein [Listeria floridensis]EUJ25870.1 hypothetical protein MFLO_14722 [Listeria floridensis FSL S10-1187]